MKRFSRLGRVVEIGEHLTVYIMTMLDCVFDGETAAVYLLYISALADHSHFSQ